MNWNYLGIDEPPPKRVTLLVLFPNNTYRLGTSTTLDIIAWSPVPSHDSIKQRCQIILRGLPIELRMIAAIVENPTTCGELCIALDNYRDTELPSFVDLVRVLDSKAHNGDRRLLNRRKTDHENFGHL